MDLTLRGLQSLGRMLPMAFSFLPGDEQGDDSGRLRETVEKIEGVIQDLKVGVKVSIGG